MPYFFAKIFLNPSKPSLNPFPSTIPKTAIHSRYYGQIQKRHLRTLPSTPSKAARTPSSRCRGCTRTTFLDYASYVILERAVPAIEDGLKPVQRRILHAMYEQHDGRYHKVANLIGQTMQYHPHGDAAIGGRPGEHGPERNCSSIARATGGDYRTGDSAAAPRYIEARLTRFALDIAFNADTTVWQLTYDGRKREPVNLPMKFPLVIAHGAEGIAVGLSTKILPHNFTEIIKASIAMLKGPATWSCTPTSPRVA